jgi:hypothetical protein
MKMAVLLLDELVAAETVWRDITFSQQPLFADMPVEKVDPDPQHKRHWMFATDEQKIMAHVYRPDYVLEKFQEIVVPIFSSAYGFGVAADQMTGFAQQLVQDTFTYLLFHELFHPVYCPKSKTDKERFDIALKDGIKRAEPHLSPRDLVNKAGNVRNAMWDLLIDTFFTHYSRNSGDLDKRLQRELQKRDKVTPLNYPQNEYQLAAALPGLVTSPVNDGQTRKLSLPDGIITTWDIIELADHDPETLFYPITRAMYGLLHCDNKNLRSAVFSYFSDKISRRISDADLENAVVGSFAGTVKYIDQTELSRIGVDKARFIAAAQELFRSRGDQKGSAARRYVTRGITEINTRAELRYISIEGMIEPLAKYISTQKEERRDGANSEDQEGGGDGQTLATQQGGGAEDVLQSMINQGDQDVDSMLPSIANDQSSPQTNRNKRLSNLAKDEYYKRNARELPIRSPTIEAETIEVGKVRTPVKVSERILTPDELHSLPMDKIIQFQQETGLVCLMRLSPYQWRYDIYEWHEQPILDYDYRKTGIILPDNIIFRVDQSGSMDTGGRANGGGFVGSKNRYDALMHSVIGVTKSAAKAAKSVQKEVSVVVVGYSFPGMTKVSKAVELQTFHDTPNNSAKKVLFNPDFGATYHDLPAYQEAHARCRPGKTIEIIVTDGDLDTDHDSSMAEIKRILESEDNLMIYFPIFQEGSFARRMGRLAGFKPNLTYKPFLSFDRIQSVANDVIVQYKEGRR